MGTYALHSGAVINKGMPFNVSEKSFCNLACSRSWACTGISFISATNKCWLHGALPNQIPIPVSDVTQYDVLRSTLGYWISFRGRKIVDSTSVPLDMTLQMCKQLCVMLGVCTQINTSIKGRCGFLLLDHKAKKKKDVDYTLYQLTKNSDGNVGKHMYT